MKRAYFDPLRILKVEKKNVLIISMKLCRVHHKLMFVIMSRLSLTHYAEKQDISEIISTSFRTEFCWVNRIIDLEQSALLILVNILGQNPKSGRKAAGTKIFSE